MSDRDGRLRALFDAIDQGYCLCEMIVDEAGTAVDYRFLEINPRFEEMTGLVDPVGRTALELVPNLEPEWVQTYARVGLGQETVRFEQGSAVMGRWFDVFATPLQPHGCFAIVFKDETARHRAETALRESEQRFRRLADELPVLVWEHDASGRRDWVNNAFVTFFGISAQEAVDPHWEMPLDPQDGPRFFERFEAAVAERHPFRDAVRARRADGRWRWLESQATARHHPDGRYLGHLGTSVDMTDRRDAEQALRESHEFISEVASLVPGVLSVFDLDERRNVFVNRSAGEVLGYRDGEIDALGSAFVPSVLHPEDAELFEDHLRSLTELEDGRSATVEYRFRHRDGTWRWFSSRDVVLRRGADGRPLQVIGISSDITDRKAAEALLRADAAVNAYRARLGEVLRTVTDPRDVPATACTLLGEHLQAGQVNFTESPDPVESAAEPTPHHPSVPRPWRPGPDGAAAPLTLDPVLVEDPRPDPEPTGTGSGAPVTPQASNSVRVPLVKQGRTVATLTVHDPQPPRQWAPEDLTVIADTAEHIWATLERARADNVLRLRQTRAEMVADLLAALEHEATLSGRLRCLLDRLVPDLADYATIEAPHQDDFLLAITHHNPDRLPTLRTLRTRCRLDPDDANSMYRAAHGEAQLIKMITPAVGQEYATDPITAHALAELGPRSHMAVPLALGGGVRGALMVGLSIPDRPHFDAEDLAFLQHVARRVEIVLAAAHLRRQEHEIAVRLQQSLLPDQLIVHPHLPIEARYVAGSELLEVGGDWYDTFSWPTGHIGVIVGDVAGHNMDSAAAMGRLRAATAALAAHVAPSPAAVLDALEAVARGPDGTGFVTATCIVVEPGSGRLTYSSAGHPPVLVLTPQRAPTHLLDAHTHAICRSITVDDAAPRPEAVHILEPGSLILMYSDGLVERRGESIDAGIAQLERAAIVLGEQPLGDLADQLVAEMTSHSPTDDDVVLVCLRYVLSGVDARASTPSNGPAR